MTHTAESQVGRPQRIVVQGPSGSGKTTLAKSLATSLRYPYLELDSVFHRENWTSLDVDTFRDVVSTFAEQPQWISDGNYSVVRDLLWRRADVIVFIDLPKWQVMTRIVKRTLRRTFGHAELWNGNRESLRNLISRDPERNIVLWTWNTHARYHETVPNEARTGAPHANVTILRGSAAVSRFAQEHQTGPRDIVGVKPQHAVGTATSKGGQVTPRITASPSISIDGYMAGPDQDEANPLGVGGRELHEWIFATKSGREMIGQSGGSEGVDDGVFSASLNDAGATIMGRNMFGPVRGSWSDSDWRGWWGDDPPFHHPVFVLTHFDRPDLIMGDTTFHFVNDGIEAVALLARAAAPDSDIHVGGGVATLGAFISAQLIDELHVAVSPIYLGAGGRLFEVAGEWPDGYEVNDVVAGEGATHYTLVRTSPMSS